jgi:hypothetical protein
MIKVRILLTCIDFPACEVFFEPEGAQTTLAEGEVFTVEISGPQDGTPEISYVPDGIVVTGWVGSDTRVWKRSGEELKV